MCNLSILAEAAVAELARYKRLASFANIKKCCKVPRILPDDLMNKKIAMVWWIEHDHQKELGWFFGKVKSFKNKTAIIKWDGENGTRKTRFSKKLYTTNASGPAGSWCVIED